MCKKAPLIPFCLITPTNDKLILRIPSNSGSKIPVINAIVPPDTPGTTSAAPIAIPLK